MSTKNITEITSKELKSMANSINLTNEDNTKSTIRNHSKYYYSTYPVYLAHFKNKASYDLNDIRLASSLAYSWMPTTPRNNFFYMQTEDELNDSIQSINELVDLDITNKAEFKRLLKPIKTNVNNSIPGMSKMLHFLYPCKYPIFDSKIAAAVSTLSVSYAVQQVSEYIDYVNAVHIRISDDDFDEIYKIVEKKFHDNYDSDYQVSKVRALELLLFATS